MGCSQNLANGHLMVSRGYLVHENLVPKFRSPYPSDVLCKLHAQAGVCRGGYGYTCIARERAACAIWCVSRWIRVCMYSV